MHKFLRLSCNLSICECIYPPLELALSGAKRGQGAKKRKIKMSGGKKKGQLGLGVKPKGEEKNY
jgi:hypothetical protein